MKKEYIVPLLVILGVSLLLIFRSEIFTSNPELQKKQSPTQQEIAEPTLEGTSWEWVETKNADGSVTRPENPSQFRMILRDMKMTSTTDCNMLHADYILDQEVISFAPLASTKMFCQDSIESLYAASFPSITSYTIENGYLTFNLMKDIGTMKFAAVQ